MQYKLIFYVLLLKVLLVAQLLYAAKNPLKPNEHWYQEVWCQGRGGRVEHILDDGRRVDCLTDEFAIEVEFAHKWSEAIGQSLDYSMLTNKKAGIVLVLRKKSDNTYWKRLHKLITHYQLPITTWKLGP